HHSFNHVLLRMFTTMMPNFWLTMKSTTNAMTRPIWTYRETLSICNFSNEREKKQKKSNNEDLISLNENLQFYPQSLPISSIITPGLQIFTDSNTDLSETSTN